MSDRPAYLPHDPEMVCADPWCALCPACLTDADRAALSRRHLSDVPVLGVDDATPPERPYTVAEAWAEMAAWSWVLIADTLETFGRVAEGAAEAAWARAAAMMRRSDELAAEFEDVPR